MNYVLSYYSFIVSPLLAIRTLLLHVKYKYVTSVKLI